MTRDMSRDEVLDLLPLYAGGDLDDEQRVVVAAALAADPTLQAEAAQWAELDGALTRGLAPAQAQVPAAAPRVVVRRRCPYCHDALQAGSIALCATCATPHHATCFAQHHGCSLLGCGGTRSMAVDAPESVVCAACEGNTPADAPFCARCGAAVAGGARPLHEAPLARVESAWSPRRYLAAAALLVASTFGMGAFFGLQQRTFVVNYSRQMGEDAARRIESRMAKLLLQLYEVQSTYRYMDLDGDGRHDFAPHIASLAAQRPKLGGSDWIDGFAWWEPHYRITLHVSADGARFCAVARPTSGDELTTWFVNHEGRVLALFGDQGAERTDCEAPAGLYLQPKDGK